LDDPPLPEETRPEPERQATVMMPDSRADDNPAARTFEMRHVFGRSHPGVSLKPFEPGGSVDAIQIASFERTVAVLLIDQDFNPAFGAEKRDEESLASPSAPVLVFFQYVCHIRIMLL